MSSEELHSTTANLESIFIGRHRYAFPGYQRDYAWIWDQNRRMGEAGRFLEDLIEYSRQGSSARFPRYDMNSIALCNHVYSEDAEEVCFVIDGQQRLTTSWMIVSAAKQLCLEIMPKMSFIHDSILIRPGVKGSLPRFRVDNRSEDVQGLIDTMAKGKSVAKFPAKSRGALNMIAVHVGIHGRLKTAFAQGVGRGSALKDKEAACERIMEFVELVFRKSEIVLVRFPDEWRAMNYYEKANNRGRPMDEPDYIKCLFYQDLDPKFQAGMTDIWTNMQTILLKAMNAGDEKYIVRNMDRLIHYHMMATTGCTRSKEGGRNAYIDAIKKALRPDGVRLGSAEIMEIVRSIEKSAEFFARIIEFKAPNGSIDHGLLAVSHMNKTFSVHHIAMFAAQDLPAHLFSRITAAIASWALVMQMTGMHRSNNEAHMMEVANILRGWKPDDVESRVERCEQALWEKKDARKVKFSQALMHRYKGRPTNNVRNMHTYILCKLEEHLDRERGCNHVYWPNVYGYVDGKASRKNSVHLEHIMPQSVLAKSPELTGDVHCLGNFTLLRASDNKSIKNRDYDSPEKKRVYAISDILLNTIMVDFSPLPGNTPDRRMRRRLQGMGLGPYENWHPDAIALRAQGVAKLVCEMCGVDFVPVYGETNLLDLPLVNDAIADGINVDDGMDLREAA